MKLLSGEQFTEYQANIAKLEKFSAMELKLSEANSVVEQLTDLNTKAEETISGLNNKVSELTEQVNALQSGSGVKPIIASGTSSKSTGDQMFDVLNRAKSVMASVGE